MSPLIVEDGWLDIKSVESLTFDELRQWIHNRLHGRDNLVGRDVRQDEAPYYLFAMIYPQLERHVRQDIERIIAGFIGSMAYNATPDWQGEAADELAIIGVDFGDYVRAIGFEGVDFGEIAFVDEEQTHGGAERDSAEEQEGESHAVDEFPAAKSKGNGGEREHRRIILAQK